jgi:hypothetical protein
MMQAPRRVTTDVVLSSEVHRKCSDGVWRPARPLYPLLALGRRIRLSWGVFIGRYDALDWQE